MNLNPGIFHRHQRRFLIFGRRTNPATNKQKHRLVLCFQRRKHIVADLIVFHNKNIT